MPVFRDFSGRTVASFAHEPRPSNLAELRTTIRNAEAHGHRVHAMGSKWSFSAPAYCPDDIVDMSLLAGIATELQSSLNPSTRIFVAVQAGIVIRDLYTALDASPTPPAGLPANLVGRNLSPRTLGGAGGQRLGGVVNTATHGGDVARGPICDSVHAMLVVGSGGEPRLMQRSSTAPVVNGSRLATALRGILPSNVTLNDMTGDTAMFDAALVSVGRFGVVYAYVIEVEDDTGFSHVEHRTFSLWSLARADLMNPTFLATRQAADEFLQIVINPIPLAGGADRRCYVTRRARAPVALPPPGGRIANAGRFLPGALPGPLASTDVMAERGPGLALFGFCATSVTLEIQLWQAAFMIIGIASLFALPYLWWNPVAFAVLVALAALCFDVVARLGRIDRTYRFGDAVADILNDVTRLGFVPVHDLVMNMTLDGGQSQTRSDGQAWLVHGRRWQVSDTFDYANDCFRADSIELFFPADGTLPGRIDALLGVLDGLRARGTPVGAYVSLRFSAGSDATLAMGGFAPASCAVEISLLRGLDSNTAAMNALRDFAVTPMGGPGVGRVHWGQWNNLTAAQVEASFGSATMTRWRTKLAEAEGRSLTFRNAFTVEHGLEPVFPEAFASWMALGITATGSPGVVSARGGRPLQVFVVGADGIVRGATRTAPSVAASWQQVRPEARDTRATPEVIRSVDGRVELFIRDANQFLTHTHETSPGGSFSSWDTKGGGAIFSDVCATAHSDGRLEIFARGFALPHRATHVWAHWVNGPWGALAELGAIEVSALQAPPSVCLRTHMESVWVGDQLVAVTTTTGGVVVASSQLGPRGDSGWTAWFPIAGPDGVTRSTNGAAVLAVNVIGPGMRVHVFAVDSTGQMAEAVDTDRTLALSFESWQPLPLLGRGERLSQTQRLAAAQNGALWLFAITTSGSVVAIRRAPDPAPQGTWGAWIDLGGAMLGDVAAGVLEDGRIELFGRRGDGQLMARRQVTPTQW